MLSDGSKWNLSEIYDYPLVESVLLFSTGTSRTAVDDNIAVYCIVDGQEIQIGHLPTWVLQKSGPLTLRTSPEKNSSAGICSPPETDREAKTPEPQRLSRASKDLAATGDLKPLNGDSGAVIPDEYLVRGEIFQASRFPLQNKF